MVKKWTENLEDILIRAFKTFIQGFLATMIVLLKENNYEDFDILKTILIGALAGGISAVMNLILKSIPKEDDDENEFEIEEEE